MCDLAGHHAQDIKSFYTFVAILRFIDLNHVRNKIIENPCLAF